MFESVMWIKQNQLCPKFVPNDITVNPQDDSRKVFSAIRVQTSILDILLKVRNVRSTSQQNLVTILNIGMIHISAVIKIHLPAPIIRL